jgi:excisionase family DNA binding protein
MKLGNNLLISIMERLDRIESLINNPKANSHKLLSIKDIIDFSGLSDPTIRRSIKRGTLKVYKKDGKKLFRRADVENWLKE